MGIQHRVEQLLRSHGRRHQIRRRTLQFSFRHQFPHQRLDWKALFLVSVQRGKVTVRIKVADIVVSLSPNAANPVDGFVHSITSGERIGSFGPHPVAQKDPTMHTERFGNPGETQSRRS